MYVFHKDHKSVIFNDVKVLVAKEEKNKTNIQTNKNKQTKTRFGFH